MIVIERVVHLSFISSFAISSHDIKGKWKFMPAPRNSSCSSPVIYVKELAFMRDVRNIERLQSSSVSHKHALKLSITPRISRGITYHRYSGSCFKPCRQAQVQREPLSRDAGSHVDWNHLGKDRKRAPGTMWPSPGSTGAP